MTQIQGLTAVIWEVWDLGSLGGPLDGGSFAVFSHAFFLVEVFGALGVGSEAWEALGLWGKGRSGAGAGSRKILGRVSG